jgi:hypothetical protein
MLRKAQKTVTFTGAAGAGAVGTTTVFTVTGEILIVALTPTCTVNLTTTGGTGTLALGVTSATTFFIAATTGDDIDAGDIWVDATPTEANAFALPSGFKDIWCTDNVIITHATNAATAGAIRFDMYWMPLSSDGAVS